MSSSSPPPNPNSDPNPNPNPPGMGSSSIDIFLQLINNPAIIDLLKSHPWFGNILLFSSPIIITTLLAITNVINIQNLSQKSKFTETICNEGNQVRSVENILRLEKKTEQITVIKEKTSLKYDDKNKETQCEYHYTIEDKSSTLKGTDSFKLEPTIYFHQLKYVGTENNEEQIRLNNKLCQHDTIKKQFNAHMKNTNSTPNVEVNFEKAKLILKEDKDNIFPVFQWMCEYELESNNSNKKKDSVSKESMGLDLDEYCKTKDETKNFLTKATHKYYNNPYSLYCVRPK